MSEALKKYLLRPDLRDLFMLGNLVLPAYLVVGSEKTALIDAGMTYMAPRYVEDIENITGIGKGPDYLLYTHSHFDHIGGTPHLLKSFPDMEICGHKYLFEVLGREKSRGSIEDLNRKMSGRFDPENVLKEDDFDFSVIRPGRALGDGEVIALGGGITIEVIHTPGHTNDSMSYFIDHLKAVATGEALGIPHGSDLYVAPEFLSSYDDYIESIEKVRKKRPEIILLGHQMIIQKGEIDRFFDNAVKHSSELKEKIKRYIQGMGPDVESVVETIKEEEYIPLREGKQPEEAYLLNLRAQVRLIARELSRD
ncbi:MAG: MBL fold metallo-hydrolase [Deltaproteobacteria bacterium]|uniref:MBL fold metallo-hydrolase n=1 Tax=Candidatus Zymogenus saltonus TaxID=2844893 RepID=A0A9D8KFV4_9DELT|nr:MBL fold metallo-hydrolase [Candidatus Zymogenus saltonus]